MFSNRKIPENSQTAKIATYRCKGDFYWFKVNDTEGTLKCLIVPAKDTMGTADESDDVIGMYNLVSGKIADNDSVEIAGNVKLVKSGDGTLVATRFR